MMQRMHAATEISQSLVAETPWRPTYHAVTQWRPTLFDVHGPCTVPTFHAQHASHNSPHAFPRPMHSMHPTTPPCMLQYYLIAWRPTPAPLQNTTQVAWMPWRPPRSPGCHGDLHHHCRIHPISTINLGCALYRIHPQEQLFVPNHCAERSSQRLKAWNFIKLFAMQLGPDDSGRNIVEIIFKSSWLKKDNPICKIERIMKVHNTQRTIQRFEDCRDAVKTRAANSTRKNPRCAADGNELLRFHCITLSCSLGARGSSSLFGSVPGCGVCTIIKQGAMLVCRVIAGRVKRMADDAPPLEEENNSSVSAPTGSYDSIAAYAGVYSDLEELFVFNPRAILPCFVVIYKALESSLN
ncbi:U-box domain-containing protein 15-like [Hibiscus syriacus]|uniref:U-box domain-containing protein 15-like n=1 Tax=Hibiscus syriacus TaxID=106335 RepID=A0A6A3D663_HIBSY|nr:U-box domain-containing protein 15-like [Hibiscus syriacus]